MDKIRKVVKYANTVKFIGINQETHFYGNIMKKKNLIDFFNLLEYRESSQIFRLG